MDKKTVAVIPARYQSTRLPGKPILMLGEKSIIQRVYEQVQKSQLVDEVIIATDDERIYDRANAFGARVEMTDPHHKSGTDRIAELAHKHNDWSVIINVQGDEPFIDPADIDRVLEPFKHDPTTEMTSLYHDIYDLKAVSDPNNVKVVTDINDDAMYFSRSPIPHIRDLHVYLNLESDADLTAEHNLEVFEKKLQDQELPSPHKKHIGLYAYRRDILLALSHLEQTTLEKFEKLEQLRALENQIKIKMIRTESEPIGIDTQKDFDDALAMIND